MRSADRSDRSNRPADRSAIRIAASICASAQAYRDGRIDHARMAERVRSGWQEAERTGRVGDVKRVLAEAYGVDLLGQPLHRPRVALAGASAGGGGKFELPEGVRGGLRALGRVTGADALARAALGLGDAGIERLVELGCRFGVSERKIAAALRARERVERAQSLLWLLLPVVPNPILLRALAGEREPEIHRKGKNRGREGSQRRAGSRDGSNGSGSVRCVHGGGGSTMAILDDQHAEGTAKPMPKGSKDVEVKVERSSYPVKGDSKEAILDSIQKSGPARNGEHFVAYTDWTIAWDFDLQKQTGKGRVARPRVGVKVAVVLPEWSPPPGAPAGLVANWKRARAAIEKHEADHASLALLAGHRVLERLKKLPPSADRATVDRAACEVIEKVKAAEVAHDKKTEHGLTQGTYL